MDTRYFILDINVIALDTVNVCLQAATMGVTFSPSGEFFASVGADEQV